MTEYSIHFIYLILPIFFCPENVVCLVYLLHTFKCIASIMEANKMNPEGVCNIGHQSKLADETVDNINEP